MFKNSLVKGPPGGRQDFFLELEWSQFKRIIEATLKGDPILWAFLHEILGKALLISSLDDITLFSNQNMSYLQIKMRLLNINTTLDYQ